MNNQGHLWILSRTVQILGLASLALSLGVGCTRPIVPESKISIQTPIVRGLKAAKELGMQSMTDGLLPAGKKACFGVEVEGPGISKSAPSQCAPPMGITSGFVEEGALLTVQVPSGNDRQFRLVAYEVDIGTPCPAWTPAFSSSGTPYSQVFEAGLTSGVSLSGADASVVIKLTLTSSSVSVADQLALGSCSSVPVLRGMLYSSGQIVNAADASFTSTDISEPFFASFFKVLGGQSDDAGLGYATSGGIVRVDGIEIQAQPFAYSFTRKPDTGGVYALTHGGSVVEIQPSGDALDISGTCPFTTCEVPVWMQSISVGYGNELFALDHGGNIYRILGPNNVQAVGLAVSPAVSQVSYY